MSGFAALIALRRSRADLDPQRTPQFGDVADVPVRLVRIDVDRTDDAERLARGKLPRDSHADRSQADVQHPYGHHRIAVWANTVIICNIRACALGGRL